MVIDRDIALGKAWVEATFLELSRAPRSRERTSLIGNEFRFDEPCVSEVGWVKDHVELAVRRSTSRHADVWDGDDELAAVVSVLLLLLQDFVSEVPSQQQAIVGTVGQELLGVMDFESRPRRVVTLLHGAAIDDVIERVTADAEVVEERASLGGGSVDGDSFAIGFE